MEYLWHTLFAIALVLAIFALMAAGWRSRKRAQAAFPELPAVPELADAGLTIPGQYVSTTKAGDWLDRIAVHGLGVRSGAQLELHPDGVLLQRSGGVPLFLARESIEEIRTEGGMAGKFVEKDGLVVLTWRLGEELLDTGFRTRKAEDRSRLLAALEELTRTNTEKNG